MRVNHAIVDLETDILNKRIGNNKASSFFPDNGIVMGYVRLYKEEAEVAENYCFLPYVDQKEAAEYVNILFKNADIIVGHNIKFDLLYLRKFYNELYEDWVRRGGTVWDTQIVEYLLSGQSHTYPSLDQCAEKYGGTLKDDKIKEYWKNGINTTEIPTSELFDYLGEDINNTELVFQKQWVEVEKAGMLSLVMTQMSALLALTEMEYNGLYFDVDAASIKCADLVKELNRLQRALIDQMKDYLPWEKMSVDITPSSPQQLSVVLYGGEVKIKNEVEVVGPDGLPLVFKSGKNKDRVKTKKVESKVSVGGMGIVPKGKAGRSGYYPTDDDALQEIAEKYKHNIDVAGFIHQLLNHRTLAKDVKTYYIGYSNLLFPDGFIHPNFNQCSTATGRLSSSNPNAQNLSNKET